MNATAKKPAKARKRKAAAARKPTAAGGAAAAAFAAPPPKRKSLTEELGEHFAIGESSDLAEKHLEWLRGERHLRLAHDADRVIDEDFVDGKMPFGDDLNIPEFIKDAAGNWIKPAVNLLVGGLATRRIFPRVYALGGDANDKMYRRAQTYDVIARGMITQARFHDFRRAALASAARSGDGWMRFGMRRERRSGELKVFANFMRWDHIFYDSAAVGANGDIDNGDWVADLRLLSLSRFIEERPEHRQIAEACAEQRFEDSQSAVDPEYGLDGFYGGGSGILGGGTGDLRKYVTLGYMYFKHEGRIFYYPFLTDRGITKIYPLAKPVMPYSHGYFPFLRWVAGMFYDNNMPYSPIVRHKRGLQRMLVHMHWRAMRETGGRAFVFDKRALPKEDGGTTMGYKEYQDYLGGQSNQPMPRIYTESLDGLKLESMMPEAGGIKDMAEWLHSLMSSSGGTTDAALIGGDARAHSGVSLQLRMDNIMRQHPDLVESDRMQHEKMMRMCVSMIDDFGKRGGLPGGYLRGDGEIGTLAEEGGKDAYETLMRDLSAGEIMAGRLGVAINTQDGAGEWAAQMQPVLLDFLRNNNNSREAVAIVTTWWIKHVDPHSRVVEDLATALVKEGIDLPDRMLSREGRAIKAKVQAQREEAMNTKQQLDERGAAEGVAKVAAEVKTEEAKAAKLHAEALAKNAETAGGGKDGGEKKAAAGGDAAKMMTELDEKDATIAKLKAMMEAAGVPLPPDMQ